MNVSRAAVAFESAAVTDTGRIRDTNEDSIASIPDVGVFVVADGVGGLAAGDVASSQVCLTICERLADSRVGTSDTFVNNTVRGAIGEANEWIRRESEARKVRAMGTTVVLLVLSAEDPARAIALHAGDSRLYRFRGGSLTQLTEDHSIAGQLGVDEQNLPQRMQGVITRAVGITEEVELDQTEVEVSPGDIFMVCSDGLTRMINDIDLTRMIGERKTDDLEPTARELVKRANEAGGYDNISVILVRVAD